MHSIFLAFILLFIHPCSAAAPATLPREEIPLPPELQEAESIEKEDHFTRDLLQMLSTLGIIVALLYGLSYFLKRFLNTRVQQLNTSSDIKIIEQRNLSPKTVLYLLELHDKHLLISESATGVTLLSTSRQLETTNELTNPRENI